MSVKLTGEFKLDILETIENIPGVVLSKTEIAKLKAVLNDSADVLVHEASGVFTPNNDYLPFYSPALDADIETIIFVTDKPMCLGVQAVGGTTPMNFPVHGLFFVQMKALNPVAALIYLEARTGTSSTPITIGDPVKWYFFALRKDAA